MEYVPEKELGIRSNEELATLYHEAVGIDPKFRMLDRESLIAGIQDPEMEKMRIAEIDRSEDKDELRKTYRK